MECRDIEFLIHFRSSELLPEDQAALAEHLSRCSACAALQQQTITMNHLWHKEFTSVPIPAGAKARAFSMARAKSREIARLYWGRRVVALSVMLVAALLAVGLVHHRRPAPDMGDLAYEQQLKYEMPQEAVEQWLAAQGYPLPPVDFQYDFYIAHGTTQILGRNVPQIVFVKVIPGTSRVDTAHVLLLPRSQFYLSQLKDARASIVGATVLNSADKDRYAWVVLHTTPTIDPFLKNRGREVAKAW